MTAAHLYATHHWRRLAKQRRDLAQDNDEPCCRCGRPIDYTLNSRHRYGPTIDHLTNPIALGGQPLPPLPDLAPAHRTCNSRHGGQLSQRLRTTRGYPPSPPTPIANGKRKKLENIENIEKVGDSSLENPVFPSARRIPSTGALVVSAKRPAPALAPTATNPASVSFSPPRILTRDHPKAVGSFASVWVPWFESALGIRLRPWQRLVLDKALQVDEAGELVWRFVLLSTPRQQGKSWLALAVALARAHHSGVFGEPQEILHVANNLVAARRIHQMSWRWAESNGLRVRKSEGREEVIWPEGSHWSITSTAAAWGASSSVVLADEVWDVLPDVVDQGLVPTLVERVQSQLWLMSTANPGTTALFPAYRRRAIEGSPRVFLAEWSAAPDADLADPEVWRAATPHWTPARAELMSAAQRTRGFAEQWCNRWPHVDDRQDRAGFPVGWDKCPGTVSPPPPLSLAAVETSQDRAVFGVAVVSRDGGGVTRVWSRSFPSAELAAEQLAVWRPAVLLVGLSIKELFPGPWSVFPVGTKETRLATPVLDDLVRRGRLEHDHDAATSGQVAAARTSLVESGLVLSAARSDGPVSSVKALCWAVWAVEDGGFAPVKPAIW